MEANESNTQDFQETPLPQRLAATAMLAYGIWLAFRALFNVGVLLSPMPSKLLLYGYTGYTVLLVINTGGAVLLWWQCDTIAAWCFRRHSEKQLKSGGMMLLQAAMPVLGAIIVGATFTTLSALFSYLLWMRNPSGDKVIERMLELRPPAFEIPLMVTYNAAMIVIGLVLMRFGTRFARRIYRPGAASQEQLDAGRSKS